MLEILNTKTQFSLYSISYINRTYISRTNNEVAHSLAHYAWQVSATTVWWASFPNFYTLAL